MNLKDRVTRVESAKVSTNVFKYHFILKMTSTQTPEESFDYYMSNAIKNNYCPELDWDELRERFLANPEKTKDVLYPIHY